MSSSNGHSNGYHDGDNLAIALPINRVLNAAAQAGSDRLPPQNLEAEQGVLGSVLIDNAVIPEILPFLKPNHFYRDTHQQVFRSYLEMIDAGQPIDLITLKAHLEAKGRLKQIGGLDFILGLLNSTPHAKNAKQYAQIVQQLFLKRELIHAANEVLREAYSEQRTAEEVQDLYKRHGERIDAECEIYVDDDTEWATAADVRKIMQATRWTWTGWIPADGIIGVAGFEGTGKTRFVLDLCRRVYECDVYPDGQLASYPKGTKSVWLCADGHHNELVETMAAFGLPDEAVLFPTLPDDPFGGTDLDSKQTISALERVVRKHRPAFVVVDTLTYATSKDICSQNVMKDLKTPLVALCQKYGVVVILILHLSKDGQALGKRVKGIARTLLHLECPDPRAESSRLRLWIEKSFSKKPAPLGVLMMEGGNQYDANPPSENAGKTAPARSKGHGKAMLSAMEWAKEHLKDGPAYAKNILTAGMDAGHSKGTIFRALDEVAIKFKALNQTSYRLPREDETPTGPSEGGDDE